MHLLAGSEEEAASRRKLLEAVPAKVAGLRSRRAHSWLDEIRRD